MITLPMTMPSGAYIEKGIRELQLYATVPGTKGSLIVVLEVWQDCPGQVSIYFMRGGLEDGIMTAQEAWKAGSALSEVVAVAQELWPREMRRAA